MIFSIDDHARRNRVALLEGASGAKWTYNELANQVFRRCDSLAGSEKSLLFLFGRNDMVSVAWYLAALESGHAVALLNDQLDEQLRAVLISMYRPEYVLSSVPVDGDAYELFSDTGLLRRRHRDTTPLHSDLALLLSTSGSTGSPKFVRLTRANVEANANSIRQALEIIETDVPVAHLPINYSYGLSVLNSHLLAGASILLSCSGLVTSGFWEAVRQHRANSFSGVPYTYQVLKRFGLDEVNAPSLRIMTQAGGKLDNVSVAYFHNAMVQRQGRFWVMYGQTEATARITILPASDLPQRLGSAGRAIPQGKLSILTDVGSCTTDAGVEGELVYTGPNVMLGYALDRADLSKGDDLNGVLYTGDRARLEEDFVHVLGRTKRDAKVFGLRVNLDELEAFVKPHGPAAAVARPEGVIIFCEFGNKNSHSQICEALSSKLKIHRSAFEFRRVDRLPTKITGKINYEELQGHV
jgi:acyl-coenzyme A synthetase/AMP-(fatty) acid ligase